MIKRLNWIDVNKGLAIFLVALGHCTSGGTQAFIYTFHMPFFFFIAGYLLNVEKWGNDFKSFIKSRFKRLIIPYFVGEMFFVILWLCYDIMRRHTWDWNNSKVVLGIFYGNGIDGWLVLADLWFLPCLFFSELFFLLLASKLKNKNIVILLSIILSIIGYTISLYYILPWELDVALFAQLFIMVGYYTKKLEAIKKIPMGIYPLLLMFCIFAWSINGRVDLNTRIYHNVMALYIGAIAGCLILMKISMLLDKKGYSVNKIIEFWGRQSLMILLFHHYIEISIAYLFRHIDPSLNNGLVYFNPIYIIVALIIGMAVPSVIAKYFGNYPILKIFNAPNR